eukprot:Pompholyxophrys_punicea_v1_NODE_56_length_4190_cov_12.775333.p4 type:complete len:175 gc:universal NODE_56_length_4190_cov_12.775333:1575-1051(-)
MLLIRSMTSSAISSMNWLCLMKTCVASSCDRDAATSLWNLGYSTILGVFRNLLTEKRDWRDSCSGLFVNALISPGRLRSLNMCRMKASVPSSRTHSTFKITMLLIFSTSIFPLTKSVMSTLDVPWKMPPLLYASRRCAMVSLDTSVKFLIFALRRYSKSCGCRFSRMSRDCGLP